MKDFKKSDESVNSASCSQSNQKISETQEKKNARLVTEGKLSLNQLEQLGGSLPSSFVNSSKYFALQTSKQSK
ncbi:MAG: hypothetical protein KFE24_06135 [Wolbachia endosymbiont of Homalodisca vitripennis]|nr:hypothetical protein [Wolbachia endosymbiont of Homalodisca vitripennis]